MAIFWVWPSLKSPFLFLKSSVFSRFSLYHIFATSYMWLVVLNLNLSKFKNPFSQLHKLYNYYYKTSNEQLCPEMSSYMFHCSEHHISANKGCKQVHNTKPKRLNGISDGLHKNSGTVDHKQCKFRSPQK